MGWFDKLDYGVIFCINCYGSINGDLEVVLQNMGYMVTFALMVDLKTRQVVHEFMEVGIGFLVVKLFKEAWFYNIFD